jgi:outer membrane protein OmpA-like peptidoglycan-associated protein
VGNDEANQKLSEHRASAVRDFLLAHGIAPDRVTAKGYGESRPVASNDTEEGRAQNRRTEVTVL